MYYAFWLAISPSIFIFWLAEGNAVRVHMYTISNDFLSHPINTSQQTLGKEGSKQHFTSGPESKEVNTLFIYLALIK